MALIVVYIFTFTNSTNSNSLNEILITKKKINKITDKMQILPNPILFALILYKICIYIEVHHIHKKKANQCQSTFTRPYKISIYV